jgi:hypothetical protein
MSWLMALRKSLILPTWIRKSATPSCRELQAQALEDWLKQLDTHLGTHALAILAKALRDVTSLRVAPAERFALLERIRIHLYRNERNTLQQSLLQTTQDSENSKRLKGLDFLWERCIQAYRMVQEECLAHYRPKIHRRLSFLSTQRQLHAWSRRFELQMKRQTQIPPAWWKAIHELYQRGEQSGWLKKQLKDPLFGSMVWEQCYLHALLIGSTGYEQLTPIQIQSLPRLVKRLVPFVAVMPLSAKTLKYQPVRHWRFSLNSTSAPKHPGLVTKVSAAIATHSTERLLVLNKVLDELKTLHPSHTGTERHLQHHWDRMPSQRRRRLKKTGKVQWTVGIDQSYLIRQLDPVAHEAPIVQGQMIDSSANGLCLETELLQTLWVGDLFSFHEPGMDQWALAVLCWLQRKPQSNVYRIGLRCLAASAKPVMIQLAPLKPSRHPQYPALMAQIPNLSSNSLLILPRKIFQPEDRILLNLEGEQKETLIGSPLMSTSRFWVSEYLSSQSLYHHS